MKPGIKVVSLATAVPHQSLGIEDIIEHFGEESTAKIVSATGIKIRRVSGNNVKTLQLALEASRTALTHAGFSPCDIEGVILVTQTPEYRLPATACILQDSLGIPKTALAFDVNLGCSGYPYGLLVANSLITSGLVSNLLLIVGDVTSITASPQDKSTYPLFSDAFTATLLKSCEGEGDILGYNFGTDGAGWMNLITPVGQARYRTSDEFYNSGGKEILPRIQYPDYTYMDGNEIFTFCLRVVPGMIKEALKKAELKMEDIDMFFFHQANLFILKHLARKMGIPEEKIPISLDRYGNTSGASPALTACDYLPGKDIKENLQVAMVAFGVGYSWSTVIMKLNPKTVCSIKEV